MQLGRPLPSEPYEPNSTADTSPGTPETPGAGPGPAAPQRDPSRTSGADAREVAPAPAHTYGLVAQHKERRFAEPKVAGGNPAEVATYRCSSARQSVGLRSQRPAVRIRPAMPHGSVAQQQSARLSTGRSRGQHPSEPPSVVARSLTASAYTSFVEKHHCRRVTRPFNSAGRKAIAPVT